MTQSVRRTGAGSPGVSSEVLAETAEMRFTLYTLAPGAEIPWHFHSEVADWYIGREGTFDVETRAPDHTARLAPGDMFQVPVRRLHRVVNSGADTCRFALVQGIGRYDFNPAADQAAAR